MTRSTSTRWGWPANRVPRSSPTASRAGIPAPGPAAPDRVSTCLPGPFVSCPRFAVYSAAMRPREATRGPSRPIVSSCEAPREATWRLPRPLNGDRLPSVQRFSLHSRRSRRLGRGYSTRFLDELEAEFDRLRGDEPTLSFEFHRSPSDRDKASAWINIEHCRLACGVVVWESGECETQIAAEEEALCSIETHQLSSPSQVSRTVRDFVNHCKSSAQSAG